MIRNVRVIFNENEDVYSWLTIWRWYDATKLNHTGEWWYNWAWINCSQLILRRSESLQFWGWNSTYGFAFCTIPASKAPFHIFFSQPCRTSLVAPTDLPLDDQQLKHAVRRASTSHRQSLDKLTGCCCYNCSPDRCSWSRRAAVVGRRRARRRMT